MVYKHLRISHAHNEDGNNLELYFVRIYINLLQSCTLPTLIPSALVLNVDRAVERYGYKIIKIRSTAIFVFSLSVNTFQQISMESVTIMHQPRRFVEQIKNTAPVVF